MFPRRLIRAGLIVATFGVLLLPAVKLRLRLALGSVVRCALRLRSHDYSAPVGSVTLILSPHQDDETLGCGGLIACKRLDAQPLHVAFLTDGRASHRDHPSITPDHLAALRATEARAALRLLGVETPAIHFLGAPDGELSHLTPAHFAAVSAQLAILLASVRPDEVFLPFRRDGSSEHEAAFRIFAHALQSTSCRPRVYEFPVWSWWNPLLLVLPVFSLRRVTRFRFAGYAFLKERALAAYRSQIAPTPPWTYSVLPAGFVRCFHSSEEFFFEH